MSQLAAPDWREARRQSARSVILDAAWSAVRDAGLAGLAMRDLAVRAGITTPTVYAYFTSKNEVYDAMFGQAAAQFEAWLSTPVVAKGRRAVLVAEFRRFVEFCTEDVARYQLLFQRTIPGFEPSRTAYAHAERALEIARRGLGELGITDPRHVDLWTAITTGLVDQQVSNDPGGNRWTALIEECVDMFDAHVVRHGHSPQVPVSRASSGRSTRDRNERRG